MSAGPRPDAISGPRLRFRVSVARPASRPPPRRREDPEPVQAGVGGERLERLVDLGQLVGPRQALRRAGRASERRGLLRLDVNARRASAAAPGASR